MIFYLSGNCSSFEPERWLEEREAICVMPSFWATVETHKKWASTPPKPALSAERRMQNIINARCAERDGKPVPDTRKTVTSKETTMECEE